MPTGVLETVQYKEIVTTVYEVITVDRIASDDLQ